MLTAMDPLLLAIPYIRSAERPVPLDHLLTDDDFPHIGDLVEMLTAEKMNKIADSKGSADLNVWKWNEEKALEFLAKKVERLTEEIQSKNLISQGDTSSSNYVIKRKDQTEEIAECTRAAWEFLSDFLQDDLSLVLAKKLKINLEASPKKPKISTKSNEMTGTKSKGPSEDYSKNNKAPAKSTPEPSTKQQKALAKSAKGTKSISSFFSKK